jgi:peptidyl-prolyl cis-trans isomerase B (cyclophilin B)
MEAFDRRWKRAVATIVVVLAAGGMTVLAIGCGGSSASEADVVGCKKVKAPKPKNLSYTAPKQTVTKGEKLTAAVSTSCGSFEIALDAERAPRTVNSFVFLAEKGVYDGLIFHRIVPKFVIQGGDPFGAGNGGPGYSIEEKPPSDLSYTKGVVAMAKSTTDPPGSSGSQFFIVLSADSGLPPEYALVGKVDEGLDVVEEIGKQGTAAGTPKQTVLLEKVSIEEG